MKYTLAEYLGELLKRNNMGAYIGQKQGRMSWMWMGGENNSMVMKGSCTIVNTQTIRIAFREIREATIYSWPEPEKLTVKKINQFLSGRKHREKSQQRNTKWTRRIVFQTSTATSITGAIH